MKSCTESPRSGSAISSRKSRARNRRERGAVVIEATIVALFLTMTFVLLVGIGGLYKAKLLAAHEARYRNTYNATNNCRPERSSLENPAVLPEEPDTSELDGNLRRITDFSTLVIHGGGVSRIATRREFSFGAKDSNGKAAFSHSVSWHSTTACNEAPVMPNPIDIVQSLGLKQLVDEIAGSMVSIF